MEVPEGVLETHGGKEYRGNKQSKEGQALSARITDSGNKPTLDDARLRKSDFDDLVRAINVNIMNSYSKFRNKDGLDEFIQGEKKRTGATGKNKPQTKLEKPDLPSRTTGLGDASLS